jgi:hypothetical protein
VQWGRDIEFPTWEGLSEEERALREAEMRRHGVMETPSGAYNVPDESATLDMTGEGNRQAMEAIMSRRSPFEGLGRSRIAEAQNVIESGISPDEMTAMRLSRPRFQQETLEIEAPLMERLEAGWRGEAAPAGRQYDISQMVEPSREDLSRSAEYWKLSGMPDALEQQRATTGKILGEAQHQAGQGEYYSAQAVAVREKMNALPEQISFEEFIKNMAPFVEGDSPEDAWEKLTRWYDQRYGTKQTPEDSQTPFWGAGGADTGGVQIPLRRGVHPTNITSPTSRTSDADYLTSVVSPPAQEPSAAPVKPEFRPGRSSLAALFRALEESKDPLYRQRLQEALQDRLGIRSFV